MASLHPLFTHAAAPCSFHYKHPIFICNILYFITQWDSWFPFPFSVVTWDLSDRTPGQQLNSVCGKYFMMGLLSKSVINVAVALTGSRVRLSFCYHPLNRDSRYHDIKLTLLWHLRGRNEAQKTDRLQKMLSRDRIALQAPSLMGKSEDVGPYASACQSSRLSISEHWHPS